MSEGRKLTKAEETERKKLGITKRAYLSKLETDKEIEGMKQSAKDFRSHMMPEPVSLEKLEEDYQATKKWAEERKPGHPGYKPPGERSPDPLDKVEEDQEKELSVTDSSHSQYDKIGEAAEYVADKDRFGEPKEEKPEEDPEQPEKKDDRGKTSTTKTEEAKLPPLTSYTKETDKDIAELVNTTKGLIEEDRDFYKQQYDKILEARKKGLDELAFRKLLGLFLDNMSRYAAGTYGEKHGIDMTQTKLSPDWGWKEQKEQLETTIDRDIAALDKTSKLQRDVTAKNFDRSLMLLDLARRERITAKRFAREAELESRRAARAKSIAEKKEKSENSKKLNDYSKYLQKKAEFQIKSAKEEIDKRQRIFNDTLSKLANPKKVDNKETAAIDLIWAAEANNSITAEQANKLAENVGLSSERDADGRTTTELFSDVTDDELKDLSGKIQAFHTKNLNTRSKTDRMARQLVSDNIEHFFKEELKLHPGYKPSPEEIEIKARKEGREELRKQLGR